MRGPRVPLRRGRRERLRRRDLPHAPGPPRMSRPRPAGGGAGRGRRRRSRGARPGPRRRSSGSRASPATRTRSRRGWPTGSRRSGSRSRSSTRIRRRSAQDPAWPGEEVARTSLPVVLGRVGRRGGTRLVLSGHMDVVPAGRPGDLDRATRGPARCATGELYGRGACDMKGGVAAILGAVRALGATGALERLQGELIVALRAVRGGRRPGHAGGDPGRRHRRPVRHPGAVVAGRRRRPRRRDHVPADRPGSGRAREPPDRGRVRARQPLATSCARSRPTRRAATRPRPIR